MIHLDPRSSHLTRWPALGAATILALTLGVAGSGCSREPKPTPAPTPTTTSNDKDHGHAHDTDTDHGKAHDDHKGHDHDAGHGGPVIELGTASIGSFTARATRDAGALAAGGEGAFDITIAPAQKDGTAAGIGSVRIWVGLESGKGSIKALAEIEDPADADRYHTHAELPSPLPADARLWVEIEDAKGTRAVGSFPLKN